MATATQQMLFTERPAEPRAAGPVECLQSVAKNVGGTGQQGAVTHDEPYVDAQRAKLDGVDSWRSQ